MFASWTERWKMTPLSRSSFKRWLQKFCVCWTTEHRSKALSKSQLDPKITADCELLESLMRLDFKLSSDDHDEGRNSDWNDFAFENVETCKTIRRDTFWRQRWIRKYEQITIIIQSNHMVMHRTHRCTVAMEKCHHFKYKLFFHPSHFMDLVLRDRFLSPKSIKKRLGKNRFGGGSGTTLKRRIF